MRHLAPGSDLIPSDDGGRLFDLPHRLVVIITDILVLPKEDVPRDKDRVVPDTVRMQDFFDIGPDVGV